MSYSEELDSCQESLIWHQCEVEWEHRPVVCVTIQAIYSLFIDGSVIGLSETRDHTIVKTCRHPSEFNGVDFSLV